jgi:energy-coupling factor transporter transmembrane protein EcfT
MSRRRRPVLATLLVVLLAWILAGLNTAIAYAALSQDVVPIITGVVFTIVFFVALRALHRAWWLAILSLVPALFILVGSVQYAPEAALERRGVTETVQITADSAANGSGSEHRYTLMGAQGQLAEPLVFRGTSPYRIGDRLEVVHDPEGVVPLEVASKVNPAGRLSGLVIGVAVWTVMAVLAGIIGHRRARTNRPSLLERLGPI